MKLKEYFSIFLLQASGNIFLWARKLEKKEGIEENYIATFNTLKSGFICKLEKTNLMIEFQKVDLRLSIFWVYRV